MKSRTTHNDKISNNSGDSFSLWMDVLLPSYSSLNIDSEADVCIIGSGIAGLTCAYNLSKKGKSVIVIDQGVIAGGQTARTTAHLTWILEERYHQLSKIHGKEKVRQVALSHAAAIDFLENVVSEEKIECGFERLDGYLFASPERPSDEISNEFKTINEMGMDVVQVQGIPFNGLTDSADALKFPRQANFHILKFLKGLLEALKKLGVRIYSNTHAKSIKDGFPCVVQTSNNCKIQAKSIIVATCTPVNNRFMIHTKQAAFRTYVLAGAIPKGSVPKALYWDTESPYHYVRLQSHLTDRELDWLIIGGEDHRTGQYQAVEEKYLLLLEWAKKHFPMLKNVSYRWSGQIFNSMDTLAYIGRNPHDKNIYIATGDSGNGITNGTIAGILISSLILNGDHPWKEIYDPSRKTLLAAPRYIHDGMNNTKQYLDWLTPGDQKKIESLHPEEGIVVRNGLNKVAIFKDEEGKVHCNSALCPHLGGCVRWNCGEKSWDCPCHGSRFDPFGKVMNGPAINNLSPHPIDD